MAYYSLPSFTSSNILGKGLFLGQRLTQQQLLLLRQTALQQQQQQIQQQQQFQQKQQHNIIQSGVQPATMLQRQIHASQHSIPKGLTKVTSSSPAIQIPAKLQIPGIEQLRPAITVSNQRIPNTLVRAGLPARSMQTDEVLALLRQQQALRLAMQTQTAAKLSQQTPTSQAGLNEAIAVAAMAAAIKPSSKPILINPVENVNVKLPPDHVSVVEGVKNTEQPTSQS